MAKISRRLLADLIKETNNRCFYCGESFEFVKIEVDHIDPFSRSRNGSSSNFAVCCQSCNRAKRDLSIEEFRIKLEEKHKKNIVFFFEKYGIQKNATPVYKFTLNQKTY